MNRVKFNFKWVALIATLIALSMSLSMCCTKKKHTINNQTESHINESKSGTEVKYVDTTIVNDSAHIITEIIFNPDSTSDIDIKSGNITGTIVSFKQTSSCVNRQKVGVSMDSIQRVNTIDSATYVSKKEVIKTNNKRAIGKVRFYLLCAVIAGIVWMYIKNKIL